MYLNNKIRKPCNTHRKKINSLQYAYQKLHERGDTTNMVRTTRYLNEMSQKIVLTKNKNNKKQILQKELICDNGDIINWKNVHKWICGKENWASKFQSNQLPMEQIILNVRLKGK